MSLGISSLLTEVLARSTGEEITSPLQIRAIGGGSINATYRITTNRNQQWFCKINDADRFPDLFVLERQGLALLEAANVIRVPKVIACDNIDQDQVLVLEWIGEGLRSTAFWQRFGEQMAALHKVTGHSFGSAPLSTTDLKVPLQNFMGALPQSNTPSPDWVDFFIHQRLEPQIALAVDKCLLTTRDVQQFQRLYKVLDSIFPKEPPALLHGDLWSGNFLCDENSRPVLIDPAVYYGHRSMDLAMTTLFGGFEPPFYEAYAYHYAFPSNYREQWGICNLYPLLIHLNLFGQSYLRNILHTIQQF